MISPLTLTTHEMPPSNNSLSFSTTDKIGPDIYTSFKLQVWVLYSPDSNFLYEKILPTDFSRINSTASCFKKSRFRSLTASGLNQLHMNTHATITALIVIYNFFLPCDMSNRLTCIECKSKTCSYENPIKDPLHALCLP